MVRVRVRIRVIQFQPKFFELTGKIKKLEKHLQELSLLSRVINDQYPGCSYGASEEERIEYEQRNVQARRQWIMREHFNRVSRLC
jgi:hypothetical protein